VVSLPTVLPIRSGKKEKVAGKRGLNDAARRHVSTTLQGINCKQMKGIIGKKIGMTSIFSPDGKQQSCTIIEAGPCVVSQIKTNETDGYTAVQLAYGDKREKHINKSEAGHFAKASASAKKVVKEFRDFSIEKAIGETVTCVRVGGGQCANCSSYGLIFSNVAMRKSKISRSLVDGDVSKLTHINNF
jgi:hypothetical protein